MPDWDDPHGLPDLPPGPDRPGVPAQPEALAAPPFPFQQEWLRACALDVQARKPGNVSLASPGHRMDAAMFLASAEAAAAPLCQPGAAVGDRIEQAVQATWGVVQCNTNLGIVLLCAPLAAAAQRWVHQPGRGSGLPGLALALGQVLARLDVQDARAAYRAIDLAQPAGLGTVPDHDVAMPPAITLREAMLLAASRDRVARQYATGYADVIEAGVPAFLSGHQAALACGAARDEALVAAMQRTFLEFLAGHADSHIVRKHGAAVAHSVMVEAAPWRQRARQGGRWAEDTAFAAWDTSLKARQLNPGTTADLCVAVAFVCLLCDARLSR